MDVFKEFTFEAAHLLPHFPEGHKCRRLHGHSYRVRVEVRGYLDESGVVVDFGTIADVWESEIHEALDHRYLNEVEGLENPTAENLAVWIWDRVLKRLPVSTVEVRETCTAGARWVGWERRGSGMALDGRRERELRCGSKDTEN